MAGLSRPILGDRKYRSESHAGSKGMRGLFLWASALELTHPVTGDAMLVKQGPPPKFSKILEREEVALSQVVRHVTAVCAAENPVNVLSCENL